MAPRNRRCAPMSTFRVLPGVQPSSFLAFCGQVCCAGGALEPETKAAARGLRVLSAGLRGLSERDRASGREEGVTAGKRALLLSVPSSAHGP